MAATSTRPEATSASPRLQPPPRSPQRSPRLRIVFFTWNYFPAPAGGAERQARLQAEELVRRGHEVTVACPRTTGERRETIGGVRVQRLLWTDKRPLRRMVYLVALVAFFCRNARRFDVVHIHLANLQADVIVPLARLFRRPVYVKVACGGSEGEVTRLAKVARLTRWIGLRHATHVQALSQQIGAELTSIGVPAERIVRIPNGLDTRGFSAVPDDEKASLREALGLPVGDVIVLFAGRFARYKGIHDLLDVWRACAWPNASLVLVGSEDTHKSTGPLAAERRVIVHGWTNSVADYLRAADVFVYPSYADGMSNALMEAMAAGLAIAASRSGATAELIENGCDGLVFDAGDRRQIGTALARLIDDADLRRRLGQAAAVSVRRFAIGLIVDRIEAVYADMVDSR